MASGRRIRRERARALDALRGMVATVTIPATLTPGIVTINGTNFNLATVAMNTVVNIPAIASVTLNRVVTSLMGANSNQTVTAVYLTLLSGVTLEIATAIPGVAST